jgi:UDP-2,3-diacylglucosamine hydrolase
MKQIAFIADLHLNEKDFHKTQYFLHWLLTEANNLDSLYILGDLFDYYLGDNCMTSLNLQIAQALSSVGDNGVEIYIMHGNRDFLIGNDFCDEAGAVLISDPYLIDEFNYHIMLTHGDLFCTNDAQYLHYRAIIRNPWLLKLLNYVPKFIKQKLAVKLRNQSQTVQIDRPFVDLDLQALHSQSDNANLIIHGHTHKPAIHNEQITRIVLGDWTNTATILILDDNGYHMKTLQIK